MCVWDWAATYYSSAGIPSSPGFDWPCSRWGCSHAHPKRAKLYFCAGPIFVAQYRRDCILVRLLTNQRHIRIKFAVYPAPPGFSVWLSHGNGQKMGAVYIVLWHCQRSSYQRVEITALWLFSWSKAWWMSGFQCPEAFSNSMMKSLGILITSRQVVHQWRRGSEASRLTMDFVTYNFSRWQLLQKILQHVTTISAFSMMILHQQHRKKHIRRYAFIDV